MDARKSNLLINIIVLLLAMITCGLWASSFGKELSWDLAGYHFYNPYAILNARFHIDYWPPSAIQTYFPPTLDFLTYFLINHFSPQMTMFMLSSLHGINFALLFYIGRFFAAEFISNVTHQIYVAGVIALLGIYSPTVIPYIGSFSNDNVVSVIILTFVLCFLLTLKSFAQTGRVNLVQVTFANVILGVAVGAKLSVAPYLIGSLAALLVLPTSLKNRFKLLVCSTLGVLAGLALALGYWMRIMWSQFHNPFFPFLNKIFHSPFFPPINWMEQRFMPSNIIEAIFFPFYFATSIKQTAEFYFLDYRFAIIFVLLALLLISFFFKKYYSPVFKRSYVIWFYLFFIFSYVTWEVHFSIMRYLGVLQMLAPVFIFLLITQLTEDIILRLLAVTGLFIFIFITMTYDEPLRVPPGKEFFDVKLPAIVRAESKATVLIAYPFFAQSGQPAPNLYLIPFFPKNWRFSGIPFRDHQYDLPKGVRDFVKRGPKQIFLLSSSQYMPYMYLAAKDLSLKPDGICGRITSDRQRLTQETILLCPVRER